MQSELVVLIPLAAVLAAASASDLRQHRIPNPVSLGGAVLGLAIAAIMAGLHGLLAAGAGFAVGLAAFLPFYVKGGMAAGDVKLMAAAGAFVGPIEALDAVALSLVAGGALGMALLILRGGLGAAVSRYMFGVRNFLTGGVWLYLRPAAGDAAAMRFPYAVAIALGTGVALALPPIIGSVFGPLVGPLGG